VLPAIIGVDEKASDHREPGVAVDARLPFVRRGQQYTNFILRPVASAPLSSPRRGFWRTVPLLASVPLAGLLAWGFVEALAPTGGGAVPAAPVVAPTTRKPGEFLAVAMGDSLTRGTGAAAGSGYVDDVGNALRARKAGFRLENIAIEGLETSGLKDLLAHPEARALAASADVIFVSIGGNDLSHAVGRGASEPPLVVLGRARRTFEANLDAILGELRERNPSAPIVYLLLYNPFGEAQLGSAGSDVIVDWNASAAKIALAHGARAVPTFDIFEGHGDRLARDKFHPNEEGYRLIAERVKEAL
jgi:lysophospholipase L1-like esterase